MKKILLLLLFVLTLSYTAENKTCLIELRSGESLKGTIINENDSTITVNSESFGNMTIDRKNIKEINNFDKSTGYRYNDPNHNSLLFMPSAETNPKGTKYFSSYELVYLNLGASPTDNLNVGLGFVFPFTPDVIAHTPITIGFKYRLLHDPFKFNVSLMSSYSFILEADNFSLLTIGGAFNYYFTPNNTIDFYLGNLLNPYDTDQKLLHYGIGLTMRTSESSKFIIEYMNGMWEDFTTDGALLFGVRFFGKQISGDIAAIKFLQFSSDSNSGWFILPLVNITYHF